MAAAETWNVDVSDCRAESHIIYNRNDDRKLGYGELAETAARIASEKGVPEDPVLKTAFEALTPGRQRGYILHFLAPKQSRTRESRIEKNIEKILNGEGLNDKYSGRKR